MKRVFYVLCAIYLVMLIKFYVSDYEILYDVNEFKVKENANGDYIYFEINYHDKIYNYMFFTGRKFIKKLVKDIEIKEVNDSVCVKPILKGIESYYMCSDSENGLVSYQLANGDISIPSLNEDFTYNKNLGEDEFVLIWKYDGFYYLNGDDYKSITIFDKDRYSNDLMFMLNGYIIFPKYSSEYLFSDFIILDAVSGKYRTVSSKYKISYDSYIVGNSRNSIFLFDNKELKLYEINYKKNSVKVVGDNAKGFIKYENGKKKPANVNDFSKDKITFFSGLDKYILLKDNMFSYSVNKDVKIKFFDSEDIHIINVCDGNIYFVYKDNLYRYNNSGVSFISHYFEFNFNYQKNVFVYNR